MKSSQPSCLVTSSRKICLNGELSDDSRTADGRLVGEECTSLQNQIENMCNTKEKREWEQVFSAVLSVARLIRANPEEVIERDGRRNRNKLSHHTICSTRSKNRS